MPLLTFSAILPLGKLQEAFVGLAVTIGLVEPCIVMVKVLVQLLASVTVTV